MLASCKDVGLGLPEAVFLWYGKSLSTVGKNEANIQGEVDTSRLEKEKQTETETSTSFEHLDPALPELVYAH